MDIQKRKANNDIKQFDRRQNIAIQITRRLNNKPNAKQPLKATNPKNLANPIPKPKLHHHPKINSKNRLDNKNSQNHTIHIF